MARQDVQRLDGEFGLQCGADRRQNLVEHPAHGEHGGAAVDGRAVHHELAQLAAGRGCGVDHGHRQPLVRQLQGGDQATNASTDNHHTVVVHGPVPGVGLTDSASVGWAAWAVACARGDGQCPCCSNRRMRTNIDSEK